MSLETTEEKARSEILQYPSRLQVTYKSKKCHYPDADDVLN